MASRNTSEAPHNYSFRPRGANLHNYKRRQLRSSLYSFTADGAVGAILTDMTDLMKVMNAMEIRPLAHRKSLALVYLAPQQLATPLRMWEGWSRLRKTRERGVGMGAEGAEGAGRGEEGGGRGAGCRG